MSFFSSAHLCHSIQAFILSAVINTQVQNVAWIQKLLVIPFQGLRTDREGNIKQNNRSQRQISQGSKNTGQKQNGTYHPHPPRDLESRGPI